MPETENRSLEEIELHFSDNSKKFTDIEIRRIIEPRDLHPKNVEGGRLSNGCEDEVRTQYILKFEKIGKCTIFTQIYQNLSKIYQNLLKICSNYSQECYN